MSASTKNPLTSVAAGAGLVLLGLLSPATASDQSSPAVLRPRTRPGSRQPVIGNRQGPTFPRTKFCRRRGGSNRFSKRNSIASWSSAEAADLIVIIPVRNKV
jgi:hypothetical protein